MTAPTPSGSAVPAAVPPVAGAVDPGADPAVDPRTVASVALAALPGIGPARLEALLERWPDPEVAVQAVREGRAPGALAGDPEAVRLARRWSAHLDLTRAEAIVSTRSTRAFVLGDGPVDPDLPDMPPILLAEGDRPDAFDRPRVSVVGTRAATPHGLADAREIGGALAEAGATVVSGMAIGIDGAAHVGALDTGGLAVGVLATGLDIVYPRRHGVLFERVRGAGLLVSELAYGTQPNRSRFPIRNRIIAALADVVVVVEATERGGARITAEEALRYGRPVLAVPGSRRNTSAAGCNALIADGAVPLLDPSDILVALGMTPGARRGWGTPERPKPRGDAARVLSVLGGEPATLDQLASRTGLTPAQLAVATVTLEREGWARRERGMVWPA